MWDLHSHGWGLRQTTSGESWGAHPGRVKAARLHRFGSLTPGSLAPDLCPVTQLLSRVGTVCLWSVRLILRTLPTGGVLLCFVLGQSLPPWDKDWESMCRMCRGLCVLLRTQSSWRLLGVSGQWTLGKLGCLETGLSEAVAGEILPVLANSGAERLTAWAVESAFLDSDPGSPTHELLTLGK